MIDKSNTTEKFRRMADSTLSLLLVLAGIALIAIALLPDTPFTKAVVLAWIVLP